MGMCLASARFKFPRRDRTPGCEHEPVRRDKRHASRVFDDRPADNTVVARARWRLQDRLNSRVAIRGLGSSREVSDSACIIGNARRRRLLDCWSKFASEVIHASPVCLHCFNSRRLYAGRLCANGFNKCEGGPRLPNVTGAGAG